MVGNFDDDPPPEIGNLVGHVVLVRETGNAVGCFEPPETGKPVGNCGERINKNRK